MIAVGVGSEVGARRSPKVAQRPGWLSAIWRGIASRRAKWRREREIRKAVAALATHDDRLLRDMGFPHRSQIEQVLRHGRDG
jgi:uncharacterized protein YjiS (DUF1127 family)